jgi:hypothetical protein
MTDDFFSELHQAFKAVHDEIREEGSEFDFRYSLVDHLFTDALGWSRTEGDGHVNFEDDRKDVLCYDDNIPPFPVIVCETKRPSHDLDLDDVDQLETYMNGVGSARYGILTNGHDFRLYRYDGNDRKVRSIVDLKIKEIATFETDDLAQVERETLEELDFLRRNRYVNIGDEEYFRDTYQEVPVQYQPGTDDQGYELFLNAVKDSLDELTGVLKRFFQDYRDRGENSYPRNFLDSTFPDWKNWREYTGKTENAKSAFCRETAYIVLNRALFARIAEDKEIVGHTRLSYRGMADALERGEKRPYLDALMDTYDQIDDHYPVLYELGIFDWWWVSQDKRGQFLSGERQRQRALEDDLDYSLGTVLKRLNRFDFSYVNRDILGQVYEDYLPKKERKELGEYYTPIEVVQFMLDSVGYKPTEGIGRKKVLDPACGSGTFLTEVTERLIQHFLQKFNKTSVHKLEADESRTILERIEENVYGIDINPFAAHISQINLLFRTIDLYDKVTEKDPYYTMEGFEIHVADTLSPTLREEKSGSTEVQGEQSSLQQFEEYNGRARAFIEDRNAVDRIKEEDVFDIVVANPPYVRIQNLSGMKEAYATRYASAIKNFDIYVPFIERGVDWLTDDGKLAYICPDRLVMADYAKAIRDQLVEEPISSIIDFKETDVFDVPTPYPCIVTIDRDQVVEGNSVRCARFAEKNDGALDKISHLEEWKTPDDADGYELFEYPQSRLAEDNQGVPAIWKPMPHKERKVFDKIESNCDARLGQITDAVFQGIITGRDKLFVGEIIEQKQDDTVQFKPPESDEPYPIEKVILRRLLKGREIERWKTDWGGKWVIFPYDVSDGTASVLTKDQLQADYPKTWAFFQDFRSSLKSREGGKWKNREKWWTFSRKQNIEKFERDKIMVSVLRKEPSFVLDTDGLYYFVGGGNAGGYGIHLKEEIARTADDTFFFGGQMNSKVTEFYHKHISPIFNDKHYSYGQKFLEPLPVGIDSDMKEEVTKIAKDIRDKSEEVTELAYRTSKITNYTADYNSNSTMLDLAKTMELGDDDYRQGPIRTNDKMGVSSERIYQVVMKQGHHIDFVDEQVRDFVFKHLTAQNKRLGRSEIQNMAVPTRENVHALMEEFETNQDRIRELERETEELQEELDDMILREVYELDDDEVSVVDEFLEVW